MIFRFILRYLGNNEQLVNKLAESYPMRRAAQFSLYLFSKSKQSITEGLEEGLKKQNFEESLKKLKEKLEDKLKE